MSIRYGQFCPVSKAAEVLGERWTILIIRELLLGTTRFRDFQRALSQISPTLLTKRLNQLQECGLVVRKTAPGQRRTEYQPMPAAKELKPIIFGLGKWGMRWARGQMNDDELDVELLMYDLHRRIDATQLPGGRTVIKFLFRGLPKFGHWWIVFENGTRELCVENPGKELDVQLTTDLRTMARIWAGDMEIRVAKKTGQIQLTGDPILIRTVSDWLRPGLFAHVRPHAEALNSERSGRTFHPAPVPSRRRKHSSLNRAFK
jgi:DNA-binding HxlR family transcriptional regulator